MVKFILWCGRLLNCLRTWKFRAKHLATVSASTVGTLHSKSQKPNEDRYGSVIRDDKQIFYVVDGAGGENNGCLAATAVQVKLDQVLPALLETWFDEDDALKAMPDILALANQEALDAGGMATLVIYVRFASGAWTLMQVGDAVFVGRDSTGIWQLPLAPLKYGPKRNVTSLIGCADINDVNPRYVTGQEQFCEFLLSSDWVCGSQSNSLIQDATPTAGLGEYHANQDLLNKLLNRFVSNGKLLVATCLEAFLVDVQDGHEQEYAMTKDDMTVIIGVHLEKSLLFD